MENPNGKFFSDFYELLTKKITANTTVMGAGNETIYKIRVKGTTDEIAEFTELINEKLGDPFSTKWAEAEYIEELATLDANLEMLYNK